MVVCELQWQYRNAHHFSMLQPLFNLRADHGAKGYLRSRAGSGIGNDDQIGLIMACSKYV